MPQDQVWYVDVSANNCNDSGPGSKNVPFCEISSGLTQAEETSNQSRTLHILGDSPYEENLEIAGGGTIALRGDQKTTLPALRVYVTSFTTVYLSQIPLTWLTGIQAPLNPPDQLNWTL